jgi:hypothetical protein
MLGLCVYDRLAGADANASERKRLINSPKN